MTSAILFQELKCSPEELGLGEQGLEGLTGEELAEKLEAGTAEARLLCVEFGAAVWQVAGSLLRPLSAA